MSETTFIDEPEAPQSDVVDLGTASEQTRGASPWISYPDGIPHWPYLFYS